MRVGSQGLRVMPRDDRLGVGERAELRHRRLADDDRARGPEPAYDLGVGGDRRGVGLAAERRHAAGDVDLLLDRDRYAVQRAGRARRRPAASSRPSASARASSASTTRERVEPGVELRRSGPATASTTSTAVTAPLVVSRTVSATPAAVRSCRSMAPLDVMARG